MRAPQTLFQPLVAAALALSLAACAPGETGDGASSADVPVDDTHADEAPPPVVWQGEFEPPIGAADMPADATESGGPWDRRLLLAFSDDGTTFQRAGLLTDQADAPDVVIDAQGRILVYYITNYEPLRDHTVVAISENGGATWVHNAIAIGLPEAWRPPADPAVVLLDDGRLRMYFSSGAELPWVGTRSAISADGIHFELEEGVRFALPDQRVIAPAVFRAGGAWHLFWIAGQGNNGHAVSDDGLNFTRVDDLTLGGGFISNGGRVGVAAVGLLFDARDATQHHTPTIRSVSSLDGATWTPGAGALLTLDQATGLEDKNVRDAGMAPLPGAGYVMVYVSHIP